MNGVEKVLETVKEKHVLVGELGAMLGLPLAEFGEAIAFLGKYELIDLLPSDNEEGPWVQITPSGMQLLNLPDLPEDELPSGQLEVLERHWGDEVDRENEEEVRWWEINEVKKVITALLGKGEGTITINQMEDKFVLTAFIPKEEEALHLHKGDISPCLHISEEAKREVEELFRRKKELFPTKHQKESV